MLDDIAQAVLAREEVVKYLRGSDGERGATLRERIYGYLDELRTTQRHPFYRALQHPLYPILRKIERKHEHLHHVVDRGALRIASSTRRTTRATPTTWSSRWCSTTTASARR